MSGASLQEQLAAMRELLERERTAHIETKASLKNALAGRSPSPPASPSAVLEQLFSPSTRDAHPAAPAAQSTLSHAISVIRGINAITQRLRAVDERTNAECCTSKATVVAVRRTMHAAVDAKCDEINASLESSRRKLLLKTIPPAASIHELLVAMNTCQRVASEALQSGDYNGFEAESAACTAALANADGSLPHLASTASSLEQGIELGFHATWAASQKTALDALRSMGGVKARGLSGPLWGLFTADLPADLQRIFRFCAPVDAEDCEGRVQWATALAYFDCALRDRTVLCAPFGGGGGAAAAVATRLPITEVAAREWCVGAIEAEELVEQYREAEQAATADGGGRGAWKALVAKGGVKKLDLSFTKFVASRFAVSEGGKRVTMQNGGGNWHPAIAGTVIEPNSGVHVWGVEVLVTGNSRIMFGVCSENASVTTPNLHNTAAAAAIFGNNDGRYGSLGTQTGSDGWHDGVTPSAGDTITLTLDTTAGTLTFEKNGHLAQGSFSNLQGKRVRPYISMHDNGDSVRFVYFVKL